MDVIEVDEHMPSMSLSLSVQFTRMTSSYTYEESNIWFTCDMWDSFTDNIHRITKGQSITLVDMSEKLTIRVSKCDENYDLRILSIKDNKNLSLQTSSALSEDEFNQLTTNFSKFPKWW